MWTDRPYFSITSINRVNFTISSINIKNFYTFEYFSLSLSIDEEKMGTNWVFRWQNFVNEKDVFIPNRSLPRTQNSVDFRFASRITRTLPEKWTWRCSWQNWNGKSEKWRESGTISASGKYIKGKLFNRKNVSCDRKCVCVCVCVFVRARARLHVQCVYKYIYILVCLVVAIFSHLVFHPLSTASIVYNFSYPSIVFSNSQRSMRVNPFLRTMQNIHRMLMFLPFTPTIAFLSIISPLPLPLFPLLHFSPPFTVPSDHNRIFRSRIRGKIFLSFQSCSPFEFYLNANNQRKRVKMKIYAD